MECSVKPAAVLPASLDRSVTLQLETIRKDEDDMLVDMRREVCFFGGAHRT